MSQDKKPKQVVVTSIEQAQSYLKKISDDADKGIIDRELFPQGKMDEGVTTATEPERLAFLNHAISFMPDKYIKHKMLLFLRVNPFRYIGGRGQYLSKAEIVRYLNKQCGIRIEEKDVDKVEKEAMRICQDALASDRKHSSPLVGANKV